VERVLGLGILALMKGMGVGALLRSLAERIDKMSPAHFPSRTYISLHLGQNAPSINALDDFVAATILKNPQISTSFNRTCHNPLNYK
jgi:hypothetical protein